MGFSRNLITKVKLREVNKDDEKEVREIVQHLFTNIVKPASRKQDSQQANTHINHLILSSLMRCT